MVARAQPDEGIVKVAMEAICPLVNQHDTINIDPHAIIHSCMEFIVSSFKS